MADPRRVYSDHEAAYKKIAASGGRGRDDLNTGRDQGSYVQLENFLGSGNVGPATPRWTL